MSKGGRYLNNNTPQKAKKPLGWKKTLLIVLIVVVIVAIIAVVAGIMFYNSKLNLINRPEVETKNPSQEEIDAIFSYVPSDSIIYESTEATTEPTVATTEDPTYYEEGKLGKIVNIMVVGQAARDEEVGKMSDTMMLCTINKETKTLTLTSFLRDTYVKLPNYVDSSGTKHSCGNQRINVNYALGYAWGGTLDAMGMLNQCIYENFGVEIDYNVEVNFDSFEDVINLLGGIDIELTEAEADHMTNDLNNVGTFTAGVNHMNGYQALQYARIRHIDSDMARGNRQRTVVTIILNQLKNMSLTELNALIDQVLPMITTNMTNDDITNCILELLPLLPKLQVVSNQCPAEGTYSGQMVEIYGVMSGVLVPNLQTNRELLTAICEDTAE